MKNRLKFKRLLFVFLLVPSIGFPLFAQQDFMFKAGIERVNRSSFYKIHLQPEIVAKCNESLSDLRISDDKGNYIPYIRYILPSAEPSFKNFPILQTSGDGDSVTSVIAENKEGLLIGSLGLKLKNTAVSRTAYLLGSDDMEKWFAIDEDIMLQQATGNNTDSYFQTLSFPSSSYKYFKITVSNKKRNPVKILSVGIYSKDTSVPEFNPLPSPIVSRIDSSDKITYLNLSFKDRFKVSKLLIPVTYPKYFKRDVLIYEIKDGIKQLLAEAELNSDSNHEIMVSFKTDKLEIRIINGDNPPLQIGRLQAFHVNEDILAYLEPGKAFHLLFGDKNAKSPDYDLKFFSDTILENVSEIKHSALMPNPLFQAPGKKKAQDFTLLMWIAIALALGLLTFLSSRMLREMKSRNQLQQ
jgi:hypothetical protein